MRYVLSSLSSAVRSNLRLVLGIALVSAAMAVAWYLTIATSRLPYEQFVYQAEAFVHGRLFLSQEPPLLVDMVQVGERFYWPLGPFSALVLTPFVAVFGVLPWETILNLVLTPLAVLLAYRIARKYEYAAPDSLWLATAFTFGSVYLGVTVRAASWQFSSAVAGLLLLAGVLEYLGKRRFWLLGILAGCAFAARFTAGISLAMFVVLATIWEHNVRPKPILRYLSRFIIPIVLIGCTLLWLNYARTGAWLDNGYTSANINADTKQLRDAYGLFSFVNIPSNLYYYFLAPPRVVAASGSFHLVPPYVTGAASMGFFLLSPIFLWLIVVRRCGPVERSALVTTGAVTLLLLTYFSVNVAEFGPRYLIDVLPLAYLVLLGVFREGGVPRRVLLVVALSVALNLYLASTLYLFR
jgi:4-amino-4-deoxy-L-arabinose transferase-like glycosyltransferase